MSSTWLIEQGLRKDSASMMVIFQYTTLACQRKCVRHLEEHFAQPEYPQGKRSRARAFLFIFVEIHLCYQV